MAFAAFPPAAVSPLVSARAESAIDAANRPALPSGYFAVTAIRSRARVTASFAASSVAVVSPLVNVRPESAIEAVYRPVLASGYLAVNANRSRVTVGSVTSAG